MQFENTLVIEKPAAEVFAFVADAENVPMWNYYVRSVRKTSAGPVGEGTRYHQVRRSDQQDYEITVFEPERAVTMRTLPGERPQFERTMTLEARGEGTRLRDEWTLALVGNPLADAVADVAAKGRVQAAVAENLGKLKELLETGETRLQDGRTVQL